MTSISAIDQVLRALRAQPLLEQATPNATIKSDNISNKPDSIQRLSSDAFAANHVAQQLQVIQEDDPQRRRRAFRAFLEGSLISLFGRDAAHFPAYQNLIDRVQMAMSADKGMSHSMDSVADVLLTFSIDPAAASKLVAAFQTASTASIHTKNDSTGK